MPTYRRPSPPHWSTSGYGVGCPTPWCARDRGPHRWPWPWPAIRAWRSTSAWTSARPGSPPSGWAWPPGDPPSSSPPAARRPPSSTPRWWRPTWPGCRCSSAPPTGHPSGATWGRPRPSTSSTSSGGRPVGSPTPVSPTPPVAGCGGRLAARMVAESRSGPSGPGPVHVNLPFREPLLGDPAAGGGVPAGRGDGAPWHAVVGGDPAPDDAWVRSRVAGGVLRPGGRGLVLAGAGCGEPDAVSDMAAALGWPILADPRSGLRRVGPGIVGAADGILRSDRFADAHLPDAIVRLGEPWVSKVVNGFVSRAVGGGAHCVVVDPHGRWPDPDREVAEFVRADPGRFAQAVTRRLAARRIIRGGCAHAVVDRLAGRRGAGPGRDRRPGGPRGPGRPDHRTVAGPPPVPGPARARPPWWCRPPCPSATSRPTASPGRGRPGSSPTGGPTASTAWCRRRSVWPLAGGPTVALVGDLAFLHDASAMVALAGDEVDLTVVVADNRGGGIFSFLPAAEVLDPRTFETLFGTPPGPDPGAVAVGLRLAGGRPGPGGGARRAGVSPGPKDRGRLPVGDPGPPPWAHGQRRPSPSHPGCHRGRRRLGRRLTVGIRRPGLSRVGDRRRGWWTPAGRSPRPSWTPEARWSPAPPGPLSGWPPEGSGDPRWRRAVG